jgi:NAD+ synthase
MTESLALALAQINPTVGDLDGNVESIRAARAEARAQAADLVIVGELAVSGYPPEDLVLKPAFQEAVKESVARLAQDTGDGGPGLIVGAPWPRDGKLYNAALLLDGGRISAEALKHELPNYGVFDERRIFTAGPLPGPVAFRGVRLGVMVCEDMWVPDVAECLDESGAEILVVINGSPFESDKKDVRLGHATARIGECGLPLVYVNLVGGQDELVFDGASFVLGADYSLRAQARAWETQVLLTHWRRSAAGGANAGWNCDQGAIAPSHPEIEAIYRALVLSLGDYVDKNGFPGVLVGLSGGVDSALTAAVAVDALGADRVRLVMMPSPYTSRESTEDAARVAELLGCRLETIPIEPAMDAFAGMLGESFRGLPANETEENIQARARGMTLMALSNKFGFMVLSTGNKSEMSVGYATLYGDMCGGFSVLKDVYKTTVFELARWRNANRPENALGPQGPVMPDRVITKPPSAELKPDQKDEDSLPPYADLDSVLRCMIEGEMSAREVVARGHDPEVVNKAWSMLDRVEYKRRQAPPGVKITLRAFGRDRRYPITNRFRAPK